MEAVTAIFFSTGGNGHEQASKEEARKEHIKKRITTQTNVLECYGKAAGKMFTSWWNDAQKAGNVKKLRFLLKIKWIAEVVFATPIFLRTLYILCRFDVVKVINTQPLGTSSIVNAVALVNFFFRKSIKVKIVLTDLPTKSDHFFKGIRAVRKANRRLIRVATCKPHLKNGETDEQFWQRKCNLSLKNRQVRYKPFPVRQAFYNPPALTKVLVNNKEEELVLSKILPSAIFTGNELCLNVTNNDEVSTVILASQSTEKAVLAYLTNTSRLFLQSGNHTNRYLFLLCGKNEPDKPSLYKKVADKILELKASNQLPKNFWPIPLSFQDDKVMASLFHEGKVFSRSSGLVSMELLTAASPKTEIYIHCETPQKVSKLSKELLENMPRHEKGNAFYLMKEKGAKLMTPDFLEEAYASQILHSHSRQNIIGAA